MIRVLAMLVRDLGELKGHLLNLVQTHDIRAAVIELGCARTLVRGHLLGLLQIPRFFPRFPLDRFRRLLIVPIIAFIVEGLLKIYMAGGFSPLRQGRWS
jgi:hypothetical protein